MSAVDKFYKWHKAEMEYLDENGPRKRRGRKPSKKQYFTYITDQAIIAYNKETDWSKRNKVFREFINYPFNKLVENIYHTFRFSYFGGSQMPEPWFPEPPPPPPPRVTQEPVIPLLYPSPP